MARRSIQLRWHGRCCACRGELAVGETAQFDDVSRELTCSECLGGTRWPASPDRASAAAQKAAEPPESGASAGVRAPQAPLRRGDADRSQVRAMIADARAALAASRHAS